VGAKNRTFAVAFLGETSMKTISLACLAALAAVPSIAQDKFNFGLSGSIAAPKNDQMKMGGTGFGLAGLAEYRFSSLAAVRLRAEYMTFGTRESYALDVPGSFMWSYSSKLHGIMTDIVLGRQERGIYLLVGFGSMWLSADSVPRDDGIRDMWQEAGIDSRDVTRRHYDANGFAYSLGAGFNFTKHIWVETKLTNVKSNGTPVSNNVFSQLSFPYRF